jgi:hypothetical protein
MKKTLYHIATSVAMITLLICTPVLVYSSPGGLEDDPGVPVDNGLGLFIAAGITYALRMVQHRKKQNKRSD